MAHVLWDTYKAAEDAEQRDLCKTAPAEVLAYDFADTHDYGALSPPERDRIVQVFGPAALSGAGMLTSRQANDIAIQDARYCLGSGQSRDLPIGFWINSYSDLAVVRYAGGCGDGQWDLVFRKFGGGWKIVAVRTHQGCAGWG